MIKLTKNLNNYINKSMILIKLLKYYLIMIKDQNNYNLRYKINQKELNNNYKFKLINHNKCQNKRNNN